MCTPESPESIIGSDVPVIAIAKTKLGELLFCAGNMIGVIRAYQQVEVNALSLSGLDRQPHFDVRKDQRDRLQRPQLGVDEESLCNCAE